MSKRPAPSSNGADNSSRSREINMARKNFEMQNNIMDLSSSSSAASSSKLKSKAPATQTNNNNNNNPMSGIETAAGAGGDLDAIFKYNPDKQKQILNTKPWQKDPNYFKRVRISALALLKMVMHARSGGKIEVMGLMQGKISTEEEGTMIIMDAFALPVEGTETRVNAQAEGYEYMVQYMNTIQQLSRGENAIGWYHSHPGYGPWLSGIDVGTQMLNQQFQEPFVAVVIDPIRTVNAGKVDIGAFRTYPQGYKAPDVDELKAEYQTIPIGKIEDFGVHCKQYYPLEVSYFKSNMDKKLFELLWHKYWITTLSSSILTANRDYMTAQMSDLAEKLERAGGALNPVAGSGGGVGGGSVGGGKIGSNKSSSSIGGGGGGGGSGQKPETALQKVTKDSSKLTIEALQGLVSHTVKDIVFNKATCSR
eukprot:Nk52_evm2s159 gene=Nk52_evmTU2s159